MQPPVSKSSGTRIRVVEYNKNNKSVTRQVCSKNSIKINSNQLSTISNAIKSVFLPTGYPDSVAEEYSTFQFYDTLQALCSYLRGVLATRAVLETLGVGSDSTTAFAAAVTWVLRDGSGMIGGLFFTYMAGQSFDADVKYWRFFADVVNDVALTLDMLAPFATQPSSAKCLLLLSAVGKSMCGIASGATRASLTAHFAKNGNMADISAKESAQETAVTLIGLCIGSTVLFVLDTHSDHMLWILFILLTMLHLYANYKAVTCLCLKTLNRSRFTLLITAFRQQKSLDIKIIDKMEGIGNEADLQVQIGKQQKNIKDVSEEVLNCFNDENYVLLMRKNNTISVILNRGACEVDQAKAYYNAYLLQHSQNHRYSIEKSYAATLYEFPNFWKELQEFKWNIDRVIFNAGPWSDWSKTILASESATKMTICHSLSKFALVLINVVFVLLGVILISIGSYMTSASDFHAFTTATVAGSTIIGCGFLVLIIAILGCCGAQCESKGFLCTYASTIVLSITIQLATAAALYKLHESLDEIQYAYNNDTGLTILSSESYHHLKYFQQAFFEIYNKCNPIIDFWKSVSSNGGIVLTCVDVRYNWFASFTSGFCTISRSDFASRGTTFMNCIAATSSSVSFVPGKMTRESLFCSCETRLLEFVNDQSALIGLIVMIVVAFEGIMLALACCFLCSSRSRQHSIYENALLLPVRKQPQSKSQYYGSYYKDDDNIPMARPIDAVIVTPTAPPPLSSKNA